MKLDASSPGANQVLSHVRLDQIGGASGLWWVARAFSDGSTQPEGIFADHADAEAEAQQLAASLGVQVIVTRFD